MQSKLYFMPGTCALAVNIVCNWSNLKIESIDIPRDQLKSEWYLKINSQGVVPALEYQGKTYTEVSAILGMIKRSCSLDADQDAYECDWWLSYLSGTLHPHFWPFFASQRFLTDMQLDEIERIKSASIIQVKKDFALIDKHLSDHKYLLGSEKSICDALMFPILRWGYLFEGGTDIYSNLDQWVRQLYMDDGVKKALEVHGIDMPKRFKA